MPVKLNCQLLVLYTVLLINCGISKINNLPEESLDSKKINECKRCKILTDSFTYWMDKTSRGKFEGGDAAWEEAKLKSYSRSEIRLVEIQEGLCSEVKSHQSQCYSLAEEAEQPLESWWFTADSNTHLFTWLCIEKLQHCCPENHFGELCQQCPMNKRNEVCNGHGKCDGDGTRRGIGHCNCYRGYSGKYCSTCAKSYVETEEGKCEPCHRSCEDCDGTALNSCKSCKKGWELVEGFCIDINECLEPLICKENQFCVNKEGSYNCKTCDNSCISCDGPGPSNCTSCPASDKLFKNMCVNEKQKQEIVSSVLSRLSLYLGLLVITYFIFRTSKVLASFVVILIASYIYFAEKVSSVNTLDMIKNYEQLF